MHHARTSILSIDRTATTIARRALLVFAHSSAACFAAVDAPQVRAWSAEGDRREAAALVRAKHHTEDPAHRETHDAQRKPLRRRRGTPSSADPCSAARSGDGLYCAESLGAPADARLYLCRARRTVRVTACAHGCTAHPPGTPDECASAPGSGAEFYLPLACGRSAPVLQGHHGSFSHNGMNTWAYDFTLPRATPVYAMESGRVTHVRSAERPGSACWNGGGRRCIEHSNYVSILHADGSRTAYLHLDAPEVTRGAIVHRGQRIGRSGNTGFSTRPHLHVQRQSNCARWFCQSRPLSFRDAGMPTTGAHVTSRNCP